MSFRTHYRCRPLSPTLPPNFISRIVSMDEESLKTMRLISRSWNTAVLRHLSDPRFQPALERVFIAQASDADYDDVDEDDEEESEENNDETRSWDVRMWAIVPDTCAAARIGLGDWLSVHEGFSDALEVTCGPQKIVKMEKQKTPIEMCMETLLGGCIIGATLCGFASRNTLNISSLIGCTMLALPPALCVYRYYNRKHDQENKEVEKKKQGTPNGRLARFFSMFSRVETLVLAGSPSLNNFGEGTLGNLHVNRLELRGFNERDKKVIIEMIMKHRIRHVSIVTHFFTCKQFNEFISDVLRTGSTIDIYGNLSVSYPTTKKYFRRSRVYWENLAQELKIREILMKFSCSMDWNFDDRLRRNYIASHMRMRRSEEGESNGDQYIFEKRGYRFRRT